jgi:hypothetical protein
MIMKALFTLAAALAVCGSPLFAEDSCIDFEEVSPKLPGWKASSREDKGEKREEKPAAKWTEPFTVTLDGDHAHSGTNSLRWEFSKETSSVTLTTPPIPISAPAVELRFFVQAQGISGALLLTLMELDVDKKPLKSHKEAEKTPLSGEWTEVVWNCPLGPEACALNIRFGATDLVGTGKIWIDDLTLKAAP